MTKKITAFDKPTVRTVSKAAMAALEKVAAEHGLTVQRSRTASYSGSELRFKVTFTLDSVGEFDKVAEAWKHNCEFFGLKKEWLGQDITVGGKVYRIEGLDTKKRVNVVILSKDGIQFSGTARTIQLYFK